MMRLTTCASVAALLTALAGPALAQTAPQNEAAIERRVQQVLRRSPIIDGHNDLPWALRENHGSNPTAVDLAQDQDAATDLHTDITRLRRGGVGGQFWSVYVPASMTPLEAARATFEQIDLTKRMIAAYPGDLELATTAADIRRIQRDGKIASLLGIEGGYSIAESMGLLREFHRSGVRYMTLTHSTTTAWADSATDDPRHGGLTPFGEEVVREMNRLGMLVDLSHVSESTMADALNVTQAPVIFSHSSARAVANHNRNVPDAILRRLPENGGLVMVTFVPSFVSEAVRAWGLARDAERERLRAQGVTEAALGAAMQPWLEANPQPSATISDVADHIDHVRQTAGVDHVGIGGDFDGVSSLPEGLNGVDKYPDLLAELVRRGWSDADLEKLTGGNLLRVMRASEEVAARLSSEPPSLAARSGEGG
ncbi:dipeptidase [Brevundimonas sp. 2R-24]|uniref:Dipeptidase n=1 Tax=Peiella sedimenti TaxID=3061083 RepID=A0ABT8SJU8_9CAUL|nr:dipeptidase [Caulobacteraceae bacterium XZ-24]